MLKIYCDFQVLQDSFLHLQQILRTFSFWCCYLSISDFFGWIACLQIQAALQFWQKPAMCLWPQDLFLTEASWSLNRRGQGKDKWRGSSLFKVVAGADLFKVDIAWLGKEPWIFQSYMARSSESAPVGISLFQYRFWACNIQECNSVPFWCGSPVLWSRVWHFRRGIAFAGNGRGHDPQGSFLKLWESGWIWVAVNYLSHPLSLLKLRLAQPLNPVP